MSTVKICLKGMDYLTKFFGEDRGGRSFLIGENIEFAMANGDDIPDGAILLYDATDYESWKLIMKERESAKGKVVIAGWYPKNIDVCSFVDPRLLSDPHYVMRGWVDLKKPMICVAEHKLGLF